MVIQLHAPSPGCSTHIVPTKNSAGDRFALLAQGTGATITLALPASPIAPARAGRSPTLEQFGVNLDLVLTAPGSSDLGLVAAPSPFL